MADAETNSGPDGQEEVVVEKQEVQAPDTKELESTIAKLQKDLENARKGEKFAKKTKEELIEQVDQLSAKIADFEAQGDWKTKYEQAEEKLKTLALDGALTEAAKAAKAKDVKAVLKLVDRSELVVKDGVVDTKAVDAALAKAKRDYGILFDQVELPPTGRAAEGDVTSGYQKEIYAAKSEAEIIAVMKRYNKA